MPKLSILDGSNYLFRAYFALMQGRGGQRSIALSNSRGMPTGALHVFTGMLLKILIEDKPDHFVTVFDHEGGSFRRAIDPAYKANRTERPDDLVPQFPYFERIIRAFRLPILKVPEVEADDVIVTLAKGCRAREHEVVIYSGDKDVMQIVDDRVHVIDGMRDIRYDAARVEEKFGVPPALVRDFLALKGDSIDNVPGVKGVGDKTAARLLREHGSIDGILAAAASIPGKLGETLRDPEQQARLKLSRELTTLKFDVKVDCDIERYRREPFSMEDVMPLFRELEFQKFIDRLVQEGPETAGGLPIASAEASSGGVVAGSSIDRGAFRSLSTPDELGEFLRHAERAGALSITTRTSNPDLPRASVCGFGLAAPDTPAVYVPVAHSYLGVPPQMREDEVVARLAPLLESRDLAKTTYDTKREWLVFHRHGVELRGVKADTLLASFLLDATRPSHDLESLASLLGHQAVPVAAVIGKGRDRRRLEEVDVATAGPWAAELAELSLRLGERFLPELDAAGLTRVYADVELPLARVLGIMEETGVKVDVRQLEELGHRTGQQCAELEAQIHDLAGYPVNVGSPKQLQELLFERLGLEPERKRKTKTGFSVDHKTLTEMKDLHPIIGLILEHRELTKLKGTYLDALPPLVDPRTGRLHTSYSQIGASTGRLASTNPNLQNVPIRTELGRQIRQAFIPEEGFTLVSLDYSQIELRVLAHLSADPVLVEAFSQDADVHARTAAEVFGVPQDEVTPLQRRVAKAVNYGLGYGQTDFGLAEALGISRGEAREYIERYFQRFARVAQYMEEAIARAHADGMVKTILGRRLALPGLASRNYMERSGAERIARNAPIQGTAADILKLAMLRVQELIDGPAFVASGSGAGPRMLLTVHDELVFEVPDALVTDFVVAARRAMEGAFPLDVPLKVDVGKGRSWADAH